MITKEKVLQYIEQIPTSQQVVQKAISLLEINELEKTVQVLQSSPVIIDYLQKMSQKGSFTLQEKNPSLNMVLVFFGCKRAKAILYSYLISTMLPKKWQLFEMSNELFFELNSDLARNWEKILERVLPSLINKYIAASALLTSSVAICDSIFGEKKEQIYKMQNDGIVDFSELLRNLTGMSIFDIASIIGKKLSFDDEVINLIEQTANISTEKINSEILLLSKYLHILLFFTLSRPNFIKAGLNTFLKFDAENVSDILDNFTTIIEVDL